MSKRHRHEDHVNHEAWAIPYGDLITLLLAFFVVMYALSSVNEGKYRVLSDSLVAAFRASPKSLEPIQVGQPSRSFGDVDVQQMRTLVPLEIDSTSIITDPIERDRGLGWGVMRTAGLSEEEIDEAATQIEALSELISEELAGLVASDLVRVRRNRFWLEIEINTSVLFPTASTELSDEALSIMQRLGAILADTNTRVQVEGHTDIVPISTPAFPSNWELSAARAGTVVRRFSGAGVEPSRMAAVGFGEFRPAADNDTAEGKARNRRVVIVVTSAGTAQRRETTTLSALEAPD